MSIYAEREFMSEDEFKRAVRSEAQIEHFWAEKLNKKSCASCDHCEAWENSDGTWEYVCVDDYGERNELGSLDFADKCDDYERDILLED